MTTTRLGRQVWVDLISTDQLRTLMQGRDETTRSLAAKTGLSHSFIGHLMTGHKRSCSIPSAQKIARALRVGTTDLFVPRVQKQKQQRDAAA